MTRPRASISLDLDNLWSYMKIHGDAGLESHPSYLDVLAPIVVERLRRHGVRLTLFIVGQDAALEKNRAALRSLSADGHEIGNHSFSHEPWFHEYSYDDVAREIGDAEVHIERATGQRPRGFRGPGFSLSRDVLRVLTERGYLYDASTFPTFLGPLARAYYFMSTRGMAEEERRKRKKLFGTAAEGLRPIRPYRWEVPGGHLLEIPVTTMPLARVPIHLSYIIYLASLSETAARAYLEAALAMCRASSVEPSFLLHPLDFLGGDRVSELAFFPGMKLPTEKKLRLFDHAVERLQHHFELVPMEEHARFLLAGALPTRALA
jgi:peptidoglycan-N-acetylglucosamine deacetylase